MIGPPTDDRLVALNRSELDRLHRLVGEKPILIADLGFAFTRPPYRFYEWGLYPDEAAAAAAYKSWAVGAAEIPYVLGFQKCQYIDRVEEQPLLGIKMGLLNFVSRLHFYCSTSLFLILCSGMRGLWRTRATPIATATEKGAVPNVSSSPCAAPSTHGACGVPR